MGSQMVHGEEGAGRGGGGGWRWSSIVLAALRSWDVPVGFAKNELVNNLWTFVLAATFHGWAVRSWLLFGLFGFGQGSCCQPMMTSSTSGGRRLVAPSPCRTTPGLHGEAKRGTKFICYLKEDESEFLGTTLEGSGEGTL